MSNITTDFIKATNKIYAKVAAILTNLQVIEGDVKLIREQVIRDANQPSPGHQTNNSEENPQAVPDAVFNALDASQPKAQKKNASDGIHSGFYRYANRWWKNIKKPKFAVELLALIGLVLYTCETHNTNSITRQTMDFQFAVARSQQRAYVMITREQQLNTIKLEDLKQAELPITVKNVGKSPANKVNYDFVIEFPRAAYGPSFDYRQLHSRGTLAPMFPDSPPDPLDIVMFDEHALPKQLDEKTRMELELGERYIAIFGQIRYEDEFGTWWTQMCGWRSFSPVPIGQLKYFNAASCVDYNIEGGTPKPIPK